LPWFFLKWTTLSLPPHFSRARLSLSAVPSVDPSLTQMTSSLSFGYAPSKIESSAHSTDASSFSAATMTETRGQGKSPPSPLMLSCLYRNHKMVCRDRPRTMPTTETSMGKDMNRRNRELWRNSLQ